MGELCARGPNVMLGYWDDAALTAQVVRDGWLHTGDLAHRDADGYLYIDGREVEMIKVGAFRVSPQEIEEVLAALPGVQEVAVTGMPDALLGQAIKAVIVPREGAAPDVMSVKAHCRAAPGQLQDSESGGIRGGVAAHLFGQSTTLQTGLRGIKMGSRNSSTQQVLELDYDQRDRAYRCAPARAPFEGSHAPRFRVRHVGRHRQLGELGAVRQGTRTRKVYGIMLPERDSSGFSTARGKQLAEHLKIRHEVFDIAPALEGIGCYRQRDEAIRRVFPEYTDGWKNKIIIKGGLEGRINHFELVVQTPAGELKTARLPLPEYLQIVAATNHKQRIRKTVEYYHADRLNYAVIGTPNRLEYDQGFFVKNGDGSADVKPIAHLYKSRSMRWRGT